MTDAAFSLSFPARQGYAIFLRTAVSGAAAAYDLPLDALEDLREACLTDLDEAMRTALRMSLAHVKDQGKTLHPDTLAALQEYEHGTPV